MDAPRLSKMLSAQLDLAGCERAELRSVERLTDELAEAGTEIFGLRAELGDALRQVDRWRTVAEQRQHRIEHWDGRDRRATATKPEPVPSEPEPPAWLAKALRPRHSHRARVTFAILALACVATLIVLGAIWPSVSLAILGGLGVGGLGGGLVWATSVAGARHGHALYRQELARSRVVGAP